MSCSKKSKNSELLELIAWGREELSRAGIEEAQEECERILIKLLGCPRSGIYLEEHELTVSGAREKFLGIIEKRLQRIPLAYLLNEANFWQETLYMDERCLIPRPETEILVEAIIKEIKACVTKSRGCHSRESGNPGAGSPIKTFGDDGLSTFSFLDIGTGSGAIAVALLRAFRSAQGTLLDISGDALEVARVNVEKYELQTTVIPAKAGIQENRSPIKTFGDDKKKKEEKNPTLAGRVRLVQGDLFEPFGSDEKWDLIVSNPPYLSDEDWKGVQEELKFEPRGALDGGKDGLDFYRRIVAGAKKHLTHGGLLALEVGQGQAEQVSKWLQTAGYDNIQHFNDHLQVQRVVTARRNC